MKCFIHKEREAVASCTRCGSGVCDDCLIRKKGKTICSECLARKSGALEGLGNTIHQLVWGIIAFRYSLPQRRDTAVVQRKGHRTKKQKNCSNYYYFCSNFRNWGFYCYVSSCKIIKTFIN